MLRGDGEAFKQQHDGGVVHPGTKDRVEREPAAAQVLVEIFFLDGVRALVGDLISFVADVELGYVALFGEFNALFVGKLGETPEDYASAAGLAMVKTVAASLLLAVANGQVGLSAQRLNGLVDQGFGLAGIFLIRRNEGRRNGGRGDSWGSRARLRGSRRRGLPRPFACLGPGRTHQNQN